MSKNKKGFKAYNYDLTCRDFQYEIGKVYEEKEAALCESGFHFCENPLDTLNYYSLIDEEGNINRFTEVEALDEVVTKKDKSVTRKIKIGAELNLGGLVKASFDYIWDKAQISKDIETNDNDHAQLASSGYRARLASSGYRAQLASSGDDAQLASSGYRARLASSGYRAQLASSGYRAQLASSGDDAQLASSGDYAQLASSGDYARLASSGYRAQLASSGYRARLASSGDYARLASSGYRAQLASSGDYCVLANIGVNGMAKGTIGTWITLAEYQYDESKGAYICICVKSAQIDGENLKENTYYQLVNKEFIEV